MHVSRVLEQTLGWATPIVRAQAANHDGPLVPPGGIRFGPPRAGPYGMGAGAVRRGNRCKVI